MQGLLSHLFHGSGYTLRLSEPYSSTCMDRTIGKLISVDHHKTYKNNTRGALLTAATYVYYVVT